MLTPSSDLDNSEAEPLRVMVIDDNPADLVAVTRALESVTSRKYDISSFDGFDAALSALTVADCRVDVCLVDYNLGSHTALDIVNALKQNKLDSVAVVVMTGQPKEASDKELMRAGVHDYWDKNKLDGETLERVLRYAHHRNKSLLDKHIESENKTRHIAHINHELKNPLNAISGYTRVLRKIMERGSQSPENHDKDRASQCLDGISNNASLLAKIIDELLDFSEIELGMFSLNVMDFVLDNVAKETFENQRVLAEEAGLSMSYTSSISGLTVFLDQHRIRQIIQNLLSNAIKYTDEGSIDMRLTQADLGGVECIKIEVQDTGIGIAESELTSVFMEFKKVHRTLRKSVESTGLGLPIAKRLVELHGGTIEAKSTLGEGSCFTVVIPRKCNVPQ